MAVTSKPWYQSSTVWINLAGIIALLLDFVVRSGSIKDADIIAIILAIVNIIRRFQVNSPVQRLEVP